MTSPSPWVTTPNPTDNSIDITDSQGEFVCDVYLGHDAEEAQLAQADARLIAMAPSLVELLRRIGEANDAESRHALGGALDAINPLLARIDGEVKP